MTDIEVALESADQCTKEEQDNTSGAGANAGPGADVVLTTTSPLSELVWSQCKGLSLQSVASNLTEKKASVVWNAESFSILISPPQHIDCGECSNTKEFSKGVRSLQLEPIAEVKDDDGIALLGSPRSTSCRNVVSLIRTHKQDPRSSEEMELDKRMEEVDFDKQRGEYNRSDEKKVEFDKSSFNAVGPEIGPDKNCPSAESLSCNGKELRNDVAQGDVECTSNFRSSPEFIKVSGEMNTYQISSLGQAGQGALLAKYQRPIMSSSSSGSAHSSNANVVLDNEEECTSEGTRRPTRSNPLRRQRSGEVQSFNFQAPRKGKPILIGSLSDDNANKLNRRKGKEPVIFDTENLQSITKEREGSHDSAESSSSRRQNSSSKRARSFDSETSIERRFKKPFLESSHSGTFLRQDSSFMNWASTITNGWFSRFTEAAPLACIPQPSHRERLQPAHMEDKDISTTCKNTGFKSMFESIYHPGFSMKNCTNEHLDHQRENSASKEVRVENEHFGHNTCQILCQRVEFNLCSIVPMEAEKANNVPQGCVSGERFDIGSCHVACEGNGEKLYNEVSTSSEGLNQSSEQIKKIPLTTTKLHEKTKYDLGQTCSNLGNTGSPCFSPKNGSQSPDDGKGSGMLLAVSNNSSNLVNGNSEFLQSLWVTRFCPKVSSTDGMNHEKDAYSICPTSEFALKKRGDQMPKSNLYPILPSQKFKKSEPIISAFARRLDAFKHIKSSAVSGGVTLTTRRCFFCGKNGHSIRECSDVSESELEGLLTNMSSRGDLDKSSCLCIRCFQHQHWAISCPYASSKRKLIACNAFSLRHENCDRTKCRRINHSFVDHDEGIIFRPENEQQEHQVGTAQRFSCSENIGMGSDAAGHSKFSRGMGENVSCNAKNSNLSPVKGSKGNIATKDEPTSSKCRENGPVENHIITFCDDVAREVTDESIEIFEIVRRLRLSRAAIIRWIQTPNSQYSLEGFFLRLRLGKYEEGLGETGYYVACINGARCKNSLSVCVAGSTYVVDCRYISNHDFLEDELKSWWSSTLRDGAKPPSKDDLTNKLQERTVFQF